MAGESTGIEEDMVGIVVDNGLASGDMARDVVYYLAEDPRGT